MIDGFDFVGLLGMDAGPMDTAVGILLRVTAVLLMAMLVAGALRRSSAALRHWVWTLALVGTLLLPLVYGGLPGWQWSVLPQRTATDLPEVSPTIAVDSRDTLRQDALPQDITQVNEFPFSHDAPESEHLEVAPMPPAAGVGLPAAPAVTAKPATQTAQPGPALSWPILLAIIWAVGTVTGLVWLIVGVACAWHVARHARETEGSRWSEILCPLLAAYGLRRPVAVRECSQVSVPMTWGLHRPVILVPVGSEAWSEATRRSVLLHELGHIRRGDCLAHLLGRLACAVYWFHPLVWLAAARLRKTSEQAADDVVLASNIAPPDYAEHLVGIAAQMRGIHLFGHVALPMASPSDLTSRVQAILDPHRNRRGLKRKTCYALMVFAAMIMIPCALLRLGYAEDDKSSEMDSETKVKEKDESQPPVTPSAEKSDESTKMPPDAIGKWQPGQTLDFRVVNARTKEPLSGVKLELQFHGKGIDFQDVKIQTTDVQGRSKIRLPDLRPDAVRVYPSKAGFVPLRIYWGDDLPSPTLPKSVTVPLEPGTVWGGVVRNEQGKPIPGVKVNVHYWERPVGNPNPHRRANIDEQTTTNKDGRWQIDVMPAKVVEDQPRIFLTHPDYVSDHLRRGHTPMPVTKRPSIKVLCNQTAVMIMRKGGVVEGRVTDEKGQPIADVRIYRQEYYWLNSGKPAATTDTDGRFHIDHMIFESSGMNNPPPSTMRAFEQRKAILTVQAPGYAPELVHVDPKKPALLEITLKPGQTVQGRVVDDSGKPIEGVSVSVSNWLGYRHRLDFQSKTDSDGQFQLTDAPPDEILYSFYKNGYMAVQDYPMLPGVNKTPTKDDYRITLKSPLRVAGKIVDTETKQPLAKCVVLKGVEYDDGRAPEWQRVTSTKTITDGRYEFEFPSKVFCWRVRVEAEGYMPTVSRIFRPGGPDKGRVTCDFNLSKAAPLAGTIINQDGKPLAGAEVFLATNLLIVKNGKAASQSLRNARMAKTDAAGRFELSPEVEPFYLVVLHELGYAVVDEKKFADDSTIRIQPWTDGDRDFRAERRPSDHRRKTPPTDAKRTLLVRVVDLEGKPVEGAHVGTSASFYSRSNYHAPDGSGWRYFPNIISDRDGMARIPVKHSIDCVVARHVERKLVAIQNVSPEQMNEKAPLKLTMHPECKIFGKMTAKELKPRNSKTTWSNVYLLTYNGHGQSMHCAVREGVFHFYAPPGTYVLYAHRRDTKRVWKTITVKPGQKELEVETINLPPSDLVLLEGKPAPELRDIVAWKNGGPVKLSDLRGKVVILAFTNLWNEPPNWSGIMPKLFSLYDKYHDLGLAVIEIRLEGSQGIDSKAKLAEKIAEVKKPFWKDRDIPIPIALALTDRIPPKANVEPKLICPVMEDYGIIGLPTGVLIDRQGRVVGQLDRSNPDDAVLEKVLKQKPDEQPALPADGESKKPVQPKAKEAIPPEPPAE